MLLGLSAFVLVASLAGLGGFQEGEAESEPAGAGRVFVPPGPEAGAAAEPLVAPAPAPSTGCRLTGTLLDQDERPLLGLALELRAFPAASEQGWRAESAAVAGCGVVVGRADSSAAGFDFPGLAPGGWALFARGGADLPPAAYLFHIGADQRARHLRLVLPRGLGLRGHVLGPEGEACPGERVVVVGLDGIYFAEERAARDGGFAFGPLLPGRYRVEANGPEHRTAAAGVALAGDGNALALQHAPAGILGVRVRDEAGLALAARVELRGPASHAGSHAGFGDELRFARLAPGVYELIARAADGRLAILQGIAVPAGLLPVPLEVVLRRGCELRLVLRGDESRAWRASWRGTLVEQGTLAPGAVATLFLPPGAVLVAWGEPPEIHTDALTLVADARPVALEHEPRPSAPGAR